MFGAPSNGRKNTYEYLGLHCSNDLCVMRQTDEADELIAYVQERISKNAPTYCDDCKKDIVNYHD
jgi:predicted Zn-dependent protease